MGRWCDGRCQEVGGENLEECCKEQGQLAEASEEDLGSKGAVVPMMVMMMMIGNRTPEVQRAASCCTDRAIQVISVDIVKLMKMRKNTKRSGRGLF